MPSVRYYNQTAPFWDFVASMEERGANHPFFADRRDDAGPSEGPRSGPWGGWGMPFWGGGHPGHGPVPHHGGPPHGHRGPHGPHGPHGGPHGHHGPHPPPPPPEDGTPGPDTEKDPFFGSDEEHEGGDPEKTPQDGDKPEEPEHPGHPYCRRRGSGRGRRGGGCGGRRGGGPGGWRGFWGGPGRGHPMMGGMEGFADFFASQLRGDTNNNDENKDAAQDFKPEADVFDTDSAFIVDIPLPGAKREDVGVNWDAEKSELSIGGVVYRNGDEEFLKTLAMDERKIGPFERKVRLGSRARPAQVDIDMITAKLEDGVLRVTVPKLDKDYVEVKKVDIA